MQSPSPPLKKHVAEVPFEEISLKREAATRRLQTVWEDIIHRYSQYGGEEDSDGGDVIDLETGTILVDHGHLRGLARTTGAVWGVPAAPRETVFRGVADLDEEDDETQADYDKDDGDDGDNDDLMGSWNQEPPSNDVSESDGDETSRQLSKNVRTLTTKLRTAPQDDQFHLALDYDALLLPPVSSSPVSTFSLHHRVEKDIGSVSDEQRFLQQFQHGERTSSSSSSSSHFFFAADRDAARLRYLFTFRNGATTGPI